MSDLDALYAPETTAAPATAPRPRAPAAGLVTLPDEQFKAALEDPRTIPRGSKLVPEQDKAIREAWPVLTRAPRPEADEKAAALNKELDQMHGAAVDVFASPKVDRRATEAVEGYYRWLREASRPEGGGRESVGPALKSIFGSSEHDPIAALRGSTRQQAINMRTLVDRIKAAKETVGGKEDELHILTSILPAPGDKPEAIARKRTAFANELEELSQGLPSQYWRAAVGHTLRARALRGPAAAPAPVAAPGTPPGAAPAAPEAEEEDPTAGYVKRALVTGATGLALPALAAIRAAISSGGETPFVKGVAANPGKPGATSFADEVANLKDVRAQNLGMKDAAAASEQEEADKAAHPILARGAQFAGGLLDPTNVLLALPGKAVAAASPLVRTAIAHALPGAAAGTLAAQGENAGALDTLKAAGLGAGLGTVLGAGGERFLGSAGKNPAIKSVVADEAKALKLDPAQVAARKATLEADTFGNAEATKAATGNKGAIEELGPKLVDWKNKLFAKYKVAADSKFATMFNAIEDAQASGDVAHAAELREAWNTFAAHRFPAELRRDSEALLNVRAVHGAAETAAHGHGAGGGMGAATMHAPSVLGNPDAPMGNKAIALSHEAAIGRLPMGLMAGGIGMLRTATAAPRAMVSQALARLYLARRAGDLNLVQQLSQHLIQSGVPFSVVSQIASGVGAPSQ